MLIVDIGTNADGITGNSVANIGSYRAAGIQMPAAWTAANLTFQVSYDGVTFANLYDNSGNEYTVTAAASRTILLPLVDFLGIAYLKIRSGTSATPVTQGAARQLQIQLV